MNSLKSESKTGACLICGDALEYSEQAKEMECVICHTAYMAHSTCKSKHYICDTCHSEKGIEVIEEIALKTSSCNPIEIAKTMMNNPFIYMHGPEHHVLAGASLLAAYVNSGGEIPLKEALSEMVIRGKQVPGGFCGFHGCCGAAVSTGIYYSIITNCSPLNKEEWSHANLMTAAALTAIAQYAGPRCCKRDSFLAIEEAVKYTAEHRGIQMQLPKRIICGYFPKNQECLKETCFFYPRAQAVRTSLHFK
jgi:hypothetical protein